MKEILVPVDFTPLAREALAYAGRLAEAFEARLNVVHVVEPSSLISMFLVSPNGFPLTVLGPVEDAHRQMAVLARNYRHIPGAWVVTYGHVADTILDIARRRGVDCIVMPPHARRGLKGWLQPRHALEVIRRAPCPVLTLRAAQAEPESASTPTPAEAEAAPA